MYSRVARDGRECSSGFAGALRSIGYVYDAENRLVEVNDGLIAGSDVYLEIDYDALGRRVLSIEHDNVEDPCDDDDPAYPVSTRHVYLGLTPIEEYQQADCPSPTPDVNWSLAREFLWGSNFPEPLALVDWTSAGEKPAGSDAALHEEWLYYLRDRLGSVVGLVAAGRQSAATGGTPAASEPRLVERYVYEPYGTTYIEAWDAGSGDFVRVSQSEFGNPFMWTGQRYDAGVGLYHFLFRSYSPELGRWMQRDPLGYVDGVSLYQAVLSAPLYFLDALGLDSLPWWVGATDWVFPGNSAQEEQDFVDNVCTACDLAGLPADIATGGLTGGLKAGAKTAAKKAIIEGIENAAERAAREAAERAAKEAAEKAAKNTAEEAAKKKSSKQLREEWEKEHGKKWPKDDAGKNQDVHHKKPKADGGTDDIDNIEPKPHPQHMKDHTDNGDFKRWGERSHQKCPEKLPKPEI